VDFERVKHTASDSARKARSKLGAWLSDTGSPGGDEPAGDDRPGYGTGPDDERRRLRAWLATRPDIAWDSRQLDQPDLSRIVFWRPGVLQVADTADHAARVTQALRQHSQVTIRSRCQQELDGAPHDIVRFEFDLRDEGRGGPTVFDVIGDVHQATGVETYPAYIALGAGGRLLFKPGGFPVPATAADVPWDTASPPPVNAPVVAVVDTGIDPSFASHPRFQDAVEVENAADLDHLYHAGQEIDLQGGHGTFIASIVRQVCPEARVVVERALDTQGVAEDVQLVWHLWRTLHAPIAGGHRVGVVVLSLEWEVGSPGPGGPTWLNSPAPFLEQVFAAHPNVVFCCAAGNDGATQPQWPAAYSGSFANVVSVGALGDPAQGRGDQPAPFSNTGDWVDAWAPGEHVAGIYVRGSYHWSPSVEQFAEPYAFWSGTSFAAPHVAAQIACAMRAKDQPTALDAWYAVRDRQRGEQTPAEAEGDAETAGSAEASAD
jgi:subtilisin family serine protease